jgi:hypothetical protein
VDVVSFGAGEPETLHPLILARSFTKIKFPITFLSITWSCHRRRR